MSATDITEGLLDRLESRVAELERDTSAEVVVVIARRADTYHDLTLLVGAGVGSLVLLALLYLPVEFPLPVVLPTTLFAAFVGTLAARRWPGFPGRLVPADRRRARAQDLAKVAFVDEAVSATRDRTGLLVFLSLMEGHVEVLPDHGLDGRIPRGHWNSLVAEALAAHGPSRWDARLEQILDRAAPLLAREFPATDDNPDEIPNRPRVLR